MIFPVVFAISLEAGEFNRYLAILKDRFEARLAAADKIYAWSMSAEKFAGAPVLGQRYDAKMISGEYAVFYIGDDIMLN